MRPTKFPLFLYLLLPLIILCLPAVTRADDKNDGDDYDVKARVVRINLIKGDVSLKRKDSSDWVNARLNAPLVEGDSIATGSNSQVELQIDARNFVRLASDSLLSIVTLRELGVALSLSEGTATIRLARFDIDKEYFEVDAPKSTIAAQTIGVYRIDAPPKSLVRLTVREGGSARIYSDTAGFTVREGTSATLIYEGANAAEWQTASLTTTDTWDDWVNEREHYLAARFKYDDNMRYYDDAIWGAEDLSSYGDWIYTNDYGWIWRPSASIISSYADWAPYRYGRWEWLPPYGWTWIGDEPWGWAPYHYGRWVYYDNYWAWCPHGYYRSQRSWWRPALVAFINIDFSFGSSYCWYPLTYYHRDPQSVHYREPLQPLRADEVAELRRINPAYLRAVTSVPARDFGSINGKFRPVTGDPARRVIDARPLRGQVPARPPTLAGTGNGRTDRPRPAVAARPTGIIDRTPGVPLDNELHRTRMFNGREPLSTPTAGGIVRAPETRSTGAVTRPEPIINRNDEGKRNPDGSAPNPVRSGIPVRPRRDDSPANPVVGNDEPRREIRPASPRPDAPTRPERPRDDGQPNRGSDGPRPPIRDIE